MLSRISLRLSDVLPRDARNCNIAKDPERGVGPTPTCRAAGASGLFSSQRPVRGGGQVLKASLIATP